MVRYLNVIHALWLPSLGQLPASPTRHVCSSVCPVLLLLVKARVSRAIHAPDPSLPALHSPPRCAKQASWWDVILKFPQLARMQSYYVVPQNPLLNIRGY
jgi:hypothetical protein